MGEFASKGVAGAGLGTGIAGLALGVLNSMGQTGLFGWNGARTAYGTALANDTVTTAYSEALAQRDAEIARLNAKVYSDESDLAIYKYFDAQLKDIRDKLATQEVYNATNNATATALANQIAAQQALLSNITRTAVPTSAICNFDGSCSCSVSAT